MRYGEACDASPLNAAINRTGRRVVVGVRLGSRPESPVAWAVRRARTGGWVDVDIINYPTRLEVNADAWEPLLAWPNSAWPAGGALSDHQQRHEYQADHALQGVLRRSSHLDGNEG